MGVKTSYRSRQALATRQTVAQAARRLFAEQGYVLTTIKAISAAAQVPVPTIYWAFGSKPAILEEVRQLWIAESDVEALHRQAMATPDPGARLQLAAHWTRRQMELGYEVIAMYQEAARAEPRVAESWREVLAGREAQVRRLLEAMKRDLRPRLTLNRAVDLYITCTLPELYRSLVIDRGWSAERYEGWLVELLVHQIVQPRT